MQQAGTSPDLSHPYSVSFIMVAFTGRLAAATSAD
jgi:hypothetical protein